MPPPPGCPETLRIPETGLAHTPSYAPVKPPIPPFPTSFSQQARNIEVQLPPLIAGALVAAFAKALADGLNNELLAHYYFPDRRPPVNLDRVLDRLLSVFARQLWDELFRFYHGSDHGSGAALSRQVALLFDGPVRQLVLVLNSPEMTRCILDKLGPGLSKRPLTWSTNTKGIGFPLALQLLCSYWHREFPDQSPGGSPDEIARALHTLITTGDAAKQLIVEMRRLLLSPHFVQIHLAESAIWDIVMKRPGRPPPDGFHIVQFKFECQLFNPLGGFGDLSHVRLASLPAVTGTAAEHVCTTVSEYVDKQWPKHGPILLGCLGEALAHATSSALGGDAFSGMSVWDGSDGKRAHCPGLRFIHIETEGSWIRMSVSAWMHTLIQVLQQMSWLCAALSYSPFPGSVVESTTEVSNWAYMDGNVYVDCSLNHSPIPDGHGSPWLHHLPRTAIASGFPLHEGSSEALL
ncbi:hypothetical protein Trco_005073 [Trichoderma cornu-damae]|uniref:Uncharacterized protein n=1 Tax=Trichoderma cornu-damae TaxID=654480 RepID=A0A9P8QIC0_9HYPO|nr:hypothetical protein Trco_005073 [Trichoderma cornu-damae]